MDRRIDKANWVMALGLAGCIFGWVGAAFAGNPTRQIVQLQVAPINEFAVSGDPQDFLVRVGDTALNSSTTYAITTNMDKRKIVYEEMFRLAHELAAKGKSVILDATFITQSLRRRAAEVAAKHNKRFVIQQTQCLKEVSLRRISERTKENYESNALTEQAYLNNKNRFEKVDLEDLKALYPKLDILHLLVDTNSDLEDEWFVIDKVIR